MAQTKEHRSNNLRIEKTLVDQSLGKKGRLRAAFDFGSGSIKIQIALIDPSIPKMLGEPLMLKYVPLTLSEDVASHEGYISIEMEEKANEVLAKFKKEAQAIAASKGYRADFAGIATDVFRKAKNGKALLQKIEKNLEIKFTILSQEEEGRLGFLTAKILYPEIDEDDLLVWDSGNGSFQITAKIGDSYKTYQGPLGHGTVRILLSKDIRGGKIIDGAVSGNPIQMDEVPQMVQRIETLLSEIPSWLEEKLKSTKTIVATFGDCESIFALVSRALKKSGGDTISLQEAKNVLEISLDRDDDFFDSNGIHRKTGTSSLLLSVIMDYFNMQTIHYKSTVGNTSGILVLPNLWKEICIESSQPEGLLGFEEEAKTESYLYKILSMDDWAKSCETLHLPSTDADFIHLSKEDQLDRIIEKYWANSSEYVVLKIKTARLSGKLVLEANPGGTNKYYHLYNGSISMDAVVESKVISFKKNFY